MHTKLFGGLLVLALLALVPNKVNAGTITCQKLDATAFYCIIAAGTNPTSSIWTVSPSSLGSFIPVPNVRYNPARTGFSCSRVPPIIMNEPPNIPDSKSGNISAEYSLVPFSPTGLLSAGSAAVTCTTSPTDPGLRIPTMNADTNDEYEEDYECEDCEDIYDDSDWDDYYAALEEYFESEDEDHYMEL